MKATLNGIHVEGTPQEIYELWDKVAAADKEKRLPRDEEDYQAFWEKMHQRAWGTPFEGPVMFPPGYGPGTIKGCKDVKLGPVEMFNGRKTGYDCAAQWDGNYDHT